MNVSGACNLNISHTYYSEQNEIPNACAIPVTIYEATSVLKNIADNITRQGPINIPNPNEQQQRWNTRYIASQNIASTMELMLACKPDLCVVYYTTTSKPVGLMILNKDGELSGYEIAGIITDFTERGIGKKLTEYAVNISYNESDYGGCVYLKVESLASRNIFMNLGFKDSGNGFLFLNPSESEQWIFENNRWSLKSTPLQHQSIAEDKEKIEERKRPLLKLDLKTFPVESNAMLYSDDPQQIRQVLTPQSVINALERVLPDSSPQIVKELDEHLRRVQDYIIQKRQPDDEILKYDSSIAIAIVNIENSRKDNLNLTLCDSIDNAISVIEFEIEKAPSHKRLIFRDTDIGQHYIFADVNIKPNASISIILFESADLGSISSYTLYATFSQKIQRLSAFSSIQMGIFDVNIQRSPADCLIFCLSFALKSYKHADQLANYHNLQHAGIPVTTYEYNVKRELFYKIGLNLYPPTILHADFIKHTHSKQVIHKQLESLSENDFLIRNMLTQKLHAGEKRLTEDGTITYLPSIEYKRRNLITRTLDTMVMKTDNDLI